MNTTKLTINDRLGVLSQRLNARHGLRITPITLRAFIRAKCCHDAESVAMMVRELYDNDEQLEGLARELQPRVTDYVMPPEPLPVADNRGVVIVCAIGVIAVAAFFWGCV